MNEQAKQNILAIHKMGVPILIAYHYVMNGRPCQCYNRYERKTVSPRTRWFENQDCIAYKE